ncbi:MAG TPA: SAM-dependent methyltransferase [Steroidobacteraceae bacterium]|nr:SAM-dependent methyltransferase [Steroidobacteraceae bacterium]
MDEAAARYSALAHAHLTSEIIAAGGWLPFERFMDLALYAPGLGYYSGGAQKLGADGDFTTAPEVSHLFGACVAVQCAEILSALRAGRVMEIGAGSGRLAADILARLEIDGRLPERYSILEISADLRERQRAYLEQRLPHLLGRVHWLDGPPEESFEGVILANEVLDALPVARFCWREHALDEMGVAIKDGQFTWAARRAEPAMTRIVQELSARSDRWDDGYMSEYCPRMGAWIQNVTQPLARGAVLWSDYGLPRAQYYLPERRDGTLVCHYRHRMSSDPFAHIGLQDISAWVDFTRVAEASQDAGLSVTAFTTQAHFLAGLGVDREMHLAAKGDENLFARLSHEARQLLLPGEMGERFKVMACVKAMDIPLSGFKLQDLRHTL